MNRINQRSSWLLLTALLLAVCVVALFVHSAPAHNPPLAAFVLLPVILFGLVLVPHSLWPSSDLDQRFSLAILCRTNLFQRPPPSCKN